LDTKQKVIVFLAFLLSLISIFGSLMYLVEGPENGFTSIAIFCIGQLLPSLL